MFRRRKGQTYRELVVDELEDRKKKKKRVKRCCCLGCICCSLLILVVIVSAIVIVLVSLKIQCTGSKVMERIHLTANANEVKSIDVKATGDIRFVSLPPGDTIEVNFTQFSITKGKQKKKKSGMTIGNHTISIDAHEPYGIHGMGWYMGDLCSGTDVIIALPDPTHTKRPKLAINAKSEYGSVYFEYSYEVGSLVVEAYQKIFVDSSRINGDFVATTVLKDIVVQDLNISERGTIDLKNRFGDITMKGMRTRFSNQSWPKIDIQTKYGDVSLHDTDRADTEIESSFTGDVDVTYYERNLGPETIGFNITTDKLSLKDIKIDANHQASSHHTVAFQGYWEYSGQRKAVGTISKVANLPIHHHLNIQGTYSGIHLTVHD